LSIVISSRALKIHASKAWWRIGLILSSTLICFQARGVELIQWQSSNLQLLHGSNYELSDPIASILTFEHTNQWLYGDFFMFIDATRFNDGEKSAYAELSPRFSFSKLSGKDYSFGPVEDLFISTTLEKGEGDAKTYLAGVGLALDIKGFRFFNTDVYWRHNPDLDDDTWQLTLAWQYPFNIGQTKWVTEGFADIAGDAGSNYAGNQLIVPRLLLDVSDFLNIKSESLWLGIEYSSWINKYGIDGVDERVIQAQIKWIFN